MNIPYVKIDRQSKDNFQFYFEDKPIHPERLYLLLQKRNPKLINVEIMRNQKTNWNAYYVVGKANSIREIFEKALNYRL